MSNLLVGSGTVLSVAFFKAQTNSDNTFGTFF